jgi:hypothetical protein
MLDFAFDPPTKMLAFEPISTRGLSPSTRGLSPVYQYGSKGWSLPEHFSAVLKWVAESNLVQPAETNFPGAMNS